MPLLDFLGSSSRSRFSPAGKLHAAANKGDAGAVRKLLAAGLNPNTCSKDNIQSTPLVLAAANGHVEAVNALLAGAASVNLRDGNGIAPVMAADVAGQVVAAERLLQAGADVAAASRADGWTCLHEAANSGLFALVPLLLRGGATVDVPAAGGRTALHVAASSGNASTVAVLLACGASPHSLDGRQLTPLLAAVQEGRVNLIHTLMHRRASLISPAGISSAFHRAAAYNQGGAILALAAEARRTGAPGCWGDAPEGAGRTPLHVAASSGAPDAIRALLQLGVEVDPLDGHSCTPLHHLALCWAPERAEQYSAAARRLLIAGADPDACNAVEQTPISIFNSRSLGTLTARLQQAAAQRKAAKIALQAGFERLRDPVAPGKVDAVREVLDMDAKTSASLLKIGDIKGCTLLHIAAANGQVAHGSVLGGSRGRCGAGNEGRAHSAACCRHPRFALVLAK